MTIPLVEEAIVRLTLNGTAMYEWRCTPSDLEALAVGRLYIDGIVTNADSVHLVVTHGQDHTVLIEARTSGAGVVRDATTNGPGMPDNETFIDLFRKLFHAVDARYEHGGMHAAAACDGQRIIKQVEDVGRHNVIDKIVGALLLDRVRPDDYGLLCSSRVSGEIASKSARAGFGWLASRSIPTTLAARVAREARMPIIGRAAARNAHVYT
jgi:FdhD protein